jgi:hypothetical protein
MPISLFTGVSTWRLESNGHWDWRRVRFNQPTEPDLAEMPAADLVLPDCMMPSGTVMSAAEMDTILEDLPSMIRVLRIEAAIHLEDYCRVASYELDDQSIRPGLVETERGPAGFFTGEAYTPRGARKTLCVSVQPAATGPARVTLFISGLDKATVVPINAYFFRLLTRAAKAGIESQGMLACAAVARNAGVPLNSQQVACLEKAGCSLTTPSGGFFRDQEA